MRAGIDPMTEDPRSVEQRDEEDVRVARWNVFVADIAERLAFETVPMILHDVAVAHADVVELTPEQQAIWSFAESEDWPDTLRAIARAMDDFENRRRRDLERC